MIIVLKPHTSEENIHRVENLVKKHGLDTHLVQGTGMTIIGCIGDTTLIDSRQFEVDTCVDKVMHVQEPYKLANRAFHPEDSIIDVSGVKIGGEHLGLIAGPCSVESYEQVLEIAQKAKASGANLLRGGAFKPRTSPYAFQGLGLEGLDILCAVREEVGLPIVTELMSSKYLDVFNEKVDLIQIGARNMQNFDLLKELGQVDRPILLKRGLNATYEEWIMSAEYIMASGNENVILCERGIRTFETFTRNTLDLQCIPVLRSKTHLPIVIDPSHAGGKWWLVEPMAKAAIAAVKNSKEIVMKLTVDLGPNSYPIHIENGILAKTGELVSEVFSGKKIMIVSDDNVFPLYGGIITKVLSDSGFECHSFVLPHGEPTKSFQSLPKIYEALLNAKLTRSDLLIALGGGVIGDLAGFAASSYLRGIKFVQIPTSLLAQVDSSVGGKVAVDLPQGKNLVGAFYHPKAVIIDPDVLNTLPDHFISDGMGEVIKYGCIKDKELFELLCRHTSFDDLKPELTQIIARCVDIKRIVVEADQFDFGERILLNFGHTLAHTIEQHFHYERESHGEAVGIGMYQITKIAEEKGLTTSGCAEQIKKALEIYKLPDNSNLPIDVLTAAISLDKKNLNNHLNVVLLHDIGDSYVYPTDVSFFDGAGIV